jgi:hypothetical protein
VLRLVGHGDVALELKRRSLAGVFSWVGREVNSGRRMEMEMEMEGGRCIGRWFGAGVRRVGTMLSGLDTGVTVCLSYTRWLRARVPYRTLEAISWRHHRHAGKGNGIEPIQQVGLQAASIHLTLGYFGWGLCAAGNVG